MNILWIYYCPLIPEAGGTERMTQLIAEGLSQDGHNCLGMLVISENGEITYNDSPVKDVYEFLNIHKVDIVINQLAMDTWLLESFLRRGGQKWKNEGGKVISCLHFDSKATSTLYYFKSKLNKTLKDRLWIARAWLFYRHYDHLQAIKAGKAYRWIYENSDWFVTLAQSHNPYFKRVTQLDDYSKLVTINNPLTFKNISSPEIIRSKKKVVLICARMDEYQKRISIALKVWEKLQDKKCSHGWVLKIVGDGPDLEYYKKFVTEKEIPNISFEGRMNPEPYYAEASIFLMTSGYEGWGLTLTESLQRGVVPIVMNTSSVFKNIIDDGFNGFLTKPNSIKAFTSRIQLLMEDNQMLSTIQLNTLKSVEKFTLNNTMKLWRKIIPPAVVK